MESAVVVGAFTIAPVIVTCSRGWSWLLAGLGVRLQPAVRVGYPRPSCPVAEEGNSLEVVQVLIGGQGCNRAIFAARCERRCEDGYATPESPAGHPADFYVEDGLLTTVDKGRHDALFRRLPDRVMDGRRSLPDVDLDGLGSAAVLRFTCEDFLLAFKLSWDSVNQPPATARTTRNQVGTSPSSAASATVCRRSTLPARSLQPRR